MIVRDLKNKFLLILFVLLGKISFAQREIPINNDSLKIRLKNVGKDVLLQFKNTTNDTIFFKKIFFLEDETANSHILSFEKIYDSTIKDTISKRVFLMDYIGEKYILDYPNAVIKVPPKTIKEFYLFHIFRNGIYFFKIKNFYIYRKKYYYTNNQTNDVKIE